jgi:hypothetical protein
VGAFSPVAPPAAVPQATSPRFGDEPSAGVTLGDDCEASVTLGGPTRQKVTAVSSGSTWKSVVVISLRRP